MAQREASSNFRELLAVREALRSFEERIEGREVQVLSDNVTVLAFQKRGGTRSRFLLSLAQELLEWAEQSPFYLSGTYKGCLQYRSGLSQPADDPPKGVGIEPPRCSPWCVGTSAAQRSLFPQREQESEEVLLAFQRERIRGGRRIGPGLGFPPGLCLSPLGSDSQDNKQIEPIRGQADSGHPLAAQEDLDNWSVSPPQRLPERQDLLLQGPVCHPNPSFFKLTAWLLKGRAYTKGGVLRGQSTPSF